MPIVGHPRHLYVHVPFCTRRCSYCDFSIAVRRTVPVDGFIQAVVLEAGHRIGPDAPFEIDTLYVGGGTPSKLGSVGIGHLIAAVTATGATLAANAEITIEANPEDVHLANVRAWVDAGVNRLSIGVQSFADDALRWMHRSHDAVQAAEAMRAARDGGIENVSIDLIYALPDAVRRTWRDDLDQALDLAPDHLSVYGLTVEPRTPLGRWTSRGEVRPQGDERAAGEFLMADARLTAAGYEHYEVSNYSRAGRRARHNSAYWARVPYLGLGPSAHSFDGEVRRWNVAALAQWEEILTSGSDPLAGEERLGPAERAAEAAYLGLRTSDGLTLHEAGDIVQARRWEGAGWATLTGTHVRLTPEGWLRLDTLVGSLGALLH